MRLRQVLAVRALALVQVGDRVEADAVDAHVEPVVERAEHRPVDVGVVEVEVGLVRVEAVPVVALGHRVPRPVRRLGVGEDDPRVGVLVGVVAPHVEVAVPAAGRCLAGPLEPRVGVRGVVHHQLDDHLEVAVVGRPQEPLEAGQVAVARVDRAVVGDVVAVVAQRRREERQHPHGVDAELDEVVELGGQPVEVADAVAVRVAERADVQLVDDDVAVPLRRAADDCGRHGRHCGTGWAVAGDHRAGGPSVGSSGGARRTNTCAGRTHGSRRTKWCQPCQR